MCLWHAKWGRADNVRDLISVITAEAWLPQIWMFTFVLCLGRVKTVAEHRHWNLDKKDMNGVRQPSLCLSNSDNSHSKWTKNGYSIIFRGLYQIHFQFLEMQHALNYIFECSLELD